MKRLPSCLVGLALIAVPAAAQKESSLIEELTSVYTARSASEVMTLAKQLDALNDAVIQKMPRAPAQPVSGAVSLAWQSAAPAIEVFRRLVDSPRKFTRWAAEEKLPAWFNVPDSVAQVHRWEGLRPILAPFASGDRLGWDLQDEPDWARRPGAWRLELQLLLRWLDREPEGVPRDLRNQAATWAAAQAGLETVREWRKSRGDTYQMLHRQYTYHVLPKPPVSSKLPRKLNEMLARVAWTGQGSLDGFLQEKEALLEDLLAGSTAAALPATATVSTDESRLCVNDYPLKAGTLPQVSKESATAAWFDSAARAFPPLSAFKPEWDATSSRIRAFEARSGAMADLLAGLREAGPGNPLSASVLWYQSTMTPDGKLAMPVAGWSSWVPEQAPPQISSSPHAQTQQHSTSPAEGVWHEICVWMAQTLSKSSPTRPIRMTIRNRTGWIFAFRQEELQEVSTQLGIPLRFASSASRGEKPLDVTLAIVRVKPHRSIRVELNIDGARAGAVEYSIPGPWPPWIASPRIPAVTSGWTWVALIALAVLVWRLWHWPASNDEGNRRLATIGAGAAGLIVAIVCMFDGPRPVPSPELGGIVEFSLPLHGASPMGLQTAVSGISLQVYKRLSELTEDDQRPIRAMSLAQRWWYAFGRMFGATPDLKVAVQRDAIMTQLEYSIVPAVIERTEPVASGRIEPSGIPAFRELMNSLAYRGEPDLPSSLMHGPPAGTRLIVNLSDGDHGGVRAPPIPDSRAGLGTILSVELATPTRDSRGAHGVLMDSRRRWLQQHSTRSVALQAGFGESLRTPLPAPPASADKSACEPVDLDSVRASWWDEKRVAVSALDAASAEIAAHAVDLLRRPKSVPTVGSHTILRLSVSPLRSIVLLVALTVLAMAYHLGTDGANWGHWRILGALAAETLLVPLISLAILAPLVHAGFSPAAWTFGEGLLDSIAVVRSWIFFLFLGAVAIRTIFVVLVKLENSPLVDPTVPEYVFSPARWFALAGGSFAVALALACWISAPIRDFGSGPWLPSDYPGSVMAGLVFWLAGVNLLTLSTQAENRARQTYAPFPTRYW